MCKSVQLQEILRKIELTFKSKNLKVEPENPNSGSPLAVSTFALLSRHLLPANMMVHFYSNRLYFCANLQMQWQYLQNKYQNIHILHH